MTHPDATVMKRAIELAKASFNAGDYAVAAVIVKGDEIIAEAATTIKSEHDPTAHAEMNVIRKAAKVLGSKDLKECYLYTTYEPCPMCASAAVWARMQGIVYGASRLDQTENAPWRVMISAEEILEHGTPTLELHPEFMREECKKLLDLK